ncbi:MULTISPECIES: hypothetical protein [Bizionia]|uniref:Uncharacterized protein n=1 Tax=Bizionia algoritergicola TaxID=291187 RepID=A0A5D0QMS4_9FLAO|nr:MULTISPECIES: hypothetical protein [Bizionia]OBX18060.1 hypothetical protein BAA08_15610 [Bizionia sp. APA-3]TYB70011.1 hypothetical protein ES675_16000 [Bizionia algoritergicola]
MNENLKSLDKKLNELVKKHSDILPEFNSGNEPADLIARMKYAEENEYFKNEVNAIKKDFDLNSKDIDFLFKMYNKKYIYGFNFPSTLEIYESML